MKQFLLAALVTSAFAPCQTGDECSSAMVLTTAGIASTTVGSTPSAEPWVVYSSPSADVWYSFVPTATQSYAIRACNIALAVDTVIEVYEGACGQLVYVDGDDDSCGAFGVGAEVNTVLNAGVTYYLRVGTYGPPGNFTLDFGAGVGSLVSVGTGGCGAASLSFGGLPARGDFLTATVENATGVALVGAGLTQLSQPFCGCTVGHEWLITSSGSTLTVAVPPMSALIGFSFLMQGVDLVSLASCPASGTSLTATFRVTIG